MARILIVEDEERIASFVAKGLRADGHRDHRASPTGATGLDHALSGDFDLVVLDIGLPGHRRLRGARPAALAGLADAGDRADRARLGHRHGLRARGRRRRLHAQAVPVRRAAGPGPAAAPAAADADGSAREDVLECRRGAARPAHPPGDRGRRDGGRPARPGSSRSPRSSCVNAGQVLSREQLLDHVWGYDFDPGSNVVDVYVGYLRKKFGADAIATVRGMGYRFNRRRP